MKQGTKKSLGVAALGAAFVAAGAGVASADSAETVRGAADTTAGAVEQAPLEDVAKGLPATSPELVGEAQDIGVGATRQLPDTTDRLLTEDEDKNALGGSPEQREQSGPAKKLLGGVPVAGGLAKQLPADQVAGDLTKNGLTGALPLG